MWASLLAQGGGSTVDENGMPNVNTPEALEALNTILRLREDGCIGTGEHGAAHEAFINGELASVTRRDLDRSTSGTHRWPTRTPP